MAEVNVARKTYFTPPVAPIKPYTGQFGRQQLKHLLRRTLFGVSNSDLKAFEGKTMTQVVDSLLNVTNFTPSPPVNDYSVTLGTYKKDPVTGKILLDTNGKPIVENYPVAGEDNGVKFGETWVNSATTLVDFQRRASFKAWWIGLMMNQERNIREKMTLFFSNHFAMEADVVSMANFTYISNQLTRKFCLGNFKDFVKAMSVDPGMLVYLNGNRNNKSAPDENYARELQELFTLGKGSGSQYTEDDVKAAARVLTGWTTNRADLTTPVVYRSAFHDTGDKKFSSFFGNKVIKGDSSANGGMNELNQLVDMIFQIDEVSKFIVRKLYTFFVYYDINTDIEKNVIEPLAELFRNSSYEIKPVLKALFTSDEFYKPTNMGSMIKSPLDHVVGLYRQFEVAIPKDPALFEAQYRLWRSAAGSTRTLGQDIQDPPNVAGWPAYYQMPGYYEMWLDTASYPQRETIQKGFSTLNGFSSGTEISNVNPDSRNIAIKIDYSNWLKTFSNPTSAFDLINDMADLFYGVPISQTVKDKLKINKLWAKQNNLQITTDKQWSDAVTAYLANPLTTDAMARTVPLRMQILVTYMMRAAEFHLH